MTDGEKMVWAAAFVLKYKAMSDRLSGYRSQNPLTRERERRDEAEAAAIFASQAVEAMDKAKKRMSNKQKKDENAYYRLSEMLKKERK